VTKAGAFGSKCNTVGVNPRKQACFRELRIRSTLAQRPRMPRIIPNGLSVHLIRRGNNRGPIFTDDYDREMFLALLETKSVELGVDVNVYTLMSNHYHAIVTPPNGERLSSMLRDLGREYVVRYNLRHKRIGTLWAGRPTVIPICDERYWLACLRYIEQNPLRAQMVVDCAEYRWSTYRIHALGEAPGWIVRHRVYLSLGKDDAERQAAYRALFAENLPTADLVRQRLGRPVLRTEWEPSDPDLVVA
jgi:REP-associated tyrosine transposase